MDFTIEGVEHLVMGLFVNLGSYQTNSNGGTEKPLFFNEGLEVAEEFRVFN